MNAKTAVGWDIHRKFSQVSVLQQSEGGEGNILMCVHAQNSNDAAKARKIFTDEKAESISTGSEAAVAAG